jgi:hypothetical protein
LGDGRVPTNLLRPWRTRGSRDGRGARGHRSLGAGSIDHVRVACCAVARADRLRLPVAVGGPPPISPLDNLARSQAPAGRLCGEPAQPATSTRRSHSPSRRP